MKCSKALKILKSDGWYEKSKKGSHIKMIHDQKKGQIIFPDHGSQELAKGTWESIKKMAGLK